MPRDSETYRRAYIRVKAIWAGAPCDITEAEKRELYVYCDGFDGMHGHFQKARTSTSTSHVSRCMPIQRPRSSGDPILGQCPDRRPLLG